MRFSSLRQRRKVMSGLRGKHAVKHPTLVRRFREELPGALRDGGGDYERIQRVVLHVLSEVSFADVRHEPGKVAKRIDRDLRDAGVQAYRAFQLARRAVEAAVKADRLAVLDSVQLPAHAGKGYRTGFEHARGIIEHAVGEGESIEVGIRNHEAWRLSGEVFTEEHHDDVGFHEGAEAFYRAAKRAYAGAPA
jgi:hypothetical protein